MIMMLAAPGVTDTPEPGGRRQSNRPWAGWAGAGHVSRWILDFLCDGGSFPGDCVVPSPVGGGARLATAGFTGAPASSPRAAEIGKKEAAFGTGALTEPTGVGAGEEVDSVACDRAQCAGRPVGGAGGQRWCSPAHLWNGRGYAGGTIDARLISGDGFSSLNQAFGAAVDCLADGPRLIEICCGEGDW